MPERGETRPASSENVNDVLEEVGSNKDTENVIIEMNFLLSYNIQWVNCAENQARQEHKLEEVMNNNPKNGTMHQSPVESFYRMLLCSCFLFEENIIVPKDCIKEDNKRIGKEDQDG